MVSVWSSGAAPVTSTVWVTWPSWSWKSSRAFWFQLERHRFANHNLEAARLDGYVVGAHRQPWQVVDTRALVWVGHSTPRRVSLAVTFALGIGAPEGSVTVPVMPAVTSCAKVTRGAVKRAAIAARERIRQAPVRTLRFRLFIGIPRWTRRFAHAAGQRPAAVSFLLRLPEYHRAPRTSFG